MKRKSTILALLLALSLVFGTFQSVFATTGPATDVTKQAIIDSGIQCIQKITNEVDAERIAMRLCETTAAGGYKLIDTATLKENLDNCVIIDTMPQGWYDPRHIPGAYCCVVGAMNGPEFKILKAEKTALWNTVKKAAGLKKQYYNSKKKKWVNSKPKKSQWKGKKTRWYSKKKIVVYCGFVGCERSHQGAMFLVKKGVTNVYRYPGGISGWVDAGYDIEGTDVEAAAESTVSE